MNTIMSHNLTIFLLMMLLSSSSAYESSPTVYEILTKFSLPIGLLPDSVKSYTLDKDGNFEVKLNNHCYIQFEYLVYYEKTITGKLRMGSISDLKGIQVQRFFIWLDVSEIRVDLPPFGCIYFQVGVINKKLDVGQFQKVLSCQDRAFVSCKESLRQVVQDQAFSRFQKNDHGDMKKLMDDKEKQIDGNNNNQRRMIERLVLEDVDTVADDFINNFKNQLKLEREDSLKHFQDMIARGI